MERKHGWGRDFWGEGDLLISLKGKVMEKEREEPVD